MTTCNIIAHAPVIELIGATRPIQDAMDRVMTYRDTTWNTDAIEDDPLSLVEFGGRVCYESFTNKKGRSRLDYIRDTAINKGHGSILEHCVFNFAVLDLPRSTLLELTRHRVGVAYSWRSTRYIDNWITYCIPPLIRDKERAIDEFNLGIMENFRCYIELKEILTREFPTKPKKEIIEASRSILSNACTADGEFSVNLRELLHIINLRTDEGADASMQEFANALADVAEPYIKDLYESKPRA